MGNKSVNNGVSLQRVYSRVQVSNVTFTKKHCRAAERRWIAVFPVTSGQSQDQRAPVMPRLSKTESIRGAVSRP